MVGLCYLGTVQQTQVGIQSVQGVFFMLITENFFTPMYSVMNQLPTQLPLFRREYTSGLYDASTFYIANVLSFVSILSTNRFIIGTLIEQITCGDDNITMCYLYILINILSIIIIITFFFHFFFVLSNCPHVQIPTLIIEPTVYTTIVYCMAGMQTDLYGYFLTVIITILVMAVSTSCGP